MSTLVEHHKVIIIGAGPGGICAAIKLAEAGIEDIVLLEKSGQVGGTWNHNRYPGAECDIRSHLYSFSFELNSDWSRPYSGQPEILAYMKRCVDKYGIAPKCRFHAGVSSAAWDDTAKLWAVDCEDGRRFVAPLLIGAVGMFSEPSVPPIEGLESFTGASFHSARWDQEFDLAGKRVAVIGSAASAIQIIPEVAKVAGKLIVYQRSPNWVLPKEGQDYTEAQIATFRSDPDAILNLRREIFDGIDVQRSYMTKAGSEKGRAAEESGLKNMMVIEDPEVRAKMKPDYPIGCRRILLSNDYYPTFNRPNVELVADGIVRIEGDAIVTTDGRRREVDGIVLATGFNTMRYITAVDVRGRDGVRLDDVWTEGPRAYRGVSVAGFPNFFILYGPNTNIGSVIYMIEQQVAYVLRHIKRMEGEGLVAIEVSEESEREYNARVQGEMDQLDIWMSGCTNYFRHPISGRVVTQWPLTMGEYGDWMAVPDEDAYLVWGIDREGVARFSSRYSQRMAVPTLD
jgi:cation diffusion facilitator CzcD-associated flavoprotein CzcO